MKFSEQFDVVTGSDDDWFDVVLSIDTPLFIDPFLLYDGEYGHFEGSHDDIIAFFNSVFGLVAESNGVTSSAKWQQAQRAVRFPEVEELCLGYTKSGTKGSGSGGGAAKVITDALWEAIQAGLTEFTHFEEIAILREQIGADRISDAVARLIRRRLGAYTKEVCERHGVEMKSFKYARGEFSPSTGRWMPLTLRLPMNPWNEMPILLVPNRFLRSLPTLNADDFWDFCFHNENNTLRAEFNQDVSKRVKKRDIVKLARRRADLRKKYLEARERERGKPYDVDRDEKGLLKWYDASAAHTQAFPLGFSIQQPNDFFDVVDGMVQEYRHFIEQNAGWRLLWNDKGPSKGEDAAQRLFLGIIKHYCKANNIDVSREPNIGRGPVDFKVSQGHAFRALMEVKLARNTRFWNGLTDQLPTYQKAEGVRRGYFIVIVFNESDDLRLRGIREAVQQVNAATDYEITHLVVDATKDKPSASKL